MTCIRQTIDMYKGKMSLSEKRVRGTKHVQVPHATDVYVNQDAGPATFKIQCTTCTCKCTMYMFFLVSFTFI